MPKHGKNINEVKVKMSDLTVYYDPDKSSPSG